MVKIITNLQTLMVLTSNVDKAKKSGNISKMRKAQEELIAYENLIRKSNEMSTDLTCNKLLISERI